MTSTGSNEYEQERCTENKVEERWTATRIISIFMRLVTAAKKRKEMRENTVNVPIF
jgi:hypothetical protein